MKMDVTKEQKIFLGVAGTFWGIHCAFKLIDTFSSEPRHLSLDKMATATFKNAMKKYAEEGIDMFVDMAIDSYDPGEFTSVREALRSPKFREKIDGKVSNRIQKYKREKKRFPDLSIVCKSAPVMERASMN